MIKFPAHIREPREWRNAYPRISNWRNAARRYAAEHGEAVAYLCDDSVIYYTRGEDGRVRQSLWQNEFGALMRRLAAQAASRSAAAE